MRTPRVMYEDKHLAHQIVLTTVPPGPKIAVSCTCRAGQPPLEVRLVFPAIAAIKVWKRHVEESVSAAHGITEPGRTLV